MCVFECMRVGLCVRLYLCRLVFECEPVVLLAHYLHTQAYTKKLRIHSTLKLTPDNRQPTSEFNKFKCSVSHVIRLHKHMLHSFGIFLLYILFDSFVGGAIIINTFTHLRFAIVCIHASTLYVCINRTLFSPSISVLL